jgi:hypothetical protein
MTLSSLRVSCDPNTISMLTYLLQRKIWRDKKNIMLSINYPICIHSIYVNSILKSANMCCTITCECVFTVMKCVYWHSASLEYLLLSWISSPTLCGVSPIASYVREVRKLFRLPGGSTLVWHSFCLYLHFN